MNINNDEIWEIIKKLKEKYPDWRFGQLVTNVSYWAKGPYAGAVWDVTDEEWKKAAKDHLKNK